jgi:hypothetical protein
MRKSIVVIGLLLATNLARAQYTPTPNIGLEVPSNGSTNWSVPLNFNFNLLDQLLGGTLQTPGFALAPRPLFGSGAPTGPCVTGVNQGQTYYDTANSFAEYVCNAGSWQPSGSSGGGATLPTNALVYGLSATTSRAVVPSDIATLLAALTGCTTSNYSYAPANGYCIPGGGITALTGPVTASGSGSVASSITATGVTPGTYNFGSQVLTVNAGGQITAAGSPFSATLACGSITCGAVEAGVTTANPATFTASYSNPTLPTSASLSDGTNSVTLTTPFTSGSLPFSYCTVAEAVTSITFRLTAVGNSQTVTPTQTISCDYRTFGGVGTAGATGATSSTTTAVLDGATGTLASAGLTNQSSYGPYSPSGQKIYILMSGGSHTFTSGGFAFPMNTPTAVSFVNQYGVTVAMYLYESTNLLSATFTVTVTS